MAIYTSYFGQIKNFPEDAIPIAICGGIPNWYTGAWYKKLAPKWKFFSEWKENHDNDFYIKHFKEEVLDKLSPAQVCLELHQMAEQRLYKEHKPTHDIILLCYEKPDEFCHRHLVADWINNWFKELGLDEMGAKVEEWSKDGIN